MDSMMSWLKACRSFSSSLFSSSSDALLADRLRQQASEVGHREKCEEIAGQPGLQRPRARSGVRGARNDAVIGQLDDAAQQNKAQRRYQKCAAARKQNAAHQEWPADRAK